MSISLILCVKYVGSLILCVTFGTDQIHLENNILGLINTKLPPLTCFGLTSNAQLKENCTHPVPKTKTY